MIKFLKSLFGIKDVEEAIEAVQPETVKVTPTPVAAKTVEKPKVKETAPKAKTVKKPATTKKTATKPAATEAKRGRKKTGVTKTDLNKMNKDELEAFAKKNYKVDLDKRKKKADLVDQVLALSNKGV